MFLPLNRGFNMITKKEIKQKINEYLSLKELINKNNQYPKSLSQKISAMDSNDSIESTIIDSFKEFKDTYDKSPDDKIKALAIEASKIKNEILKIFKNKKIITISSTNRKDLINIINKIKHLIIIGYNTGNFCSFRFIVEDDDELSKCLQSNDKILSINNKIKLNDIILFFNRDKAYMQNAKDLKECKKLIKKRKMFQEKYDELMEQKNLVTRLIHNLECSIKKDYLNKFGQFYSSLDFLQNNDAENAKESIDKIYSLIPKNIKLFIERKLDISREKNSELFNFVYQKLISEMELEKNNNLSLINILFNSHEYKTLINIQNKLKDINLNTTDYKIVKSKNKDNCFVEKLTLVLSENKIPYLILKSKQPNKKDVLFFVNKKYDIKNLVDGLLIRNIDNPFYL